MLATIIIFFLFTVISFLGVKNSNLREKNSALEGENRYLKYTAIEYINKTLKLTAIIETSKKQFSQEEIMTLIKLCHPDKHNNSAMSNNITKKLLVIRKAG